MCVLWILYVYQTLLKWNILLWKSLKWGFTLLEPLMEIKLHFGFIFVHKHALNKWNQGDFWSSTLHIYYFSPYVLLVENDIFPRIYYFFDNLIIRGEGLWILDVFVGNTRWCHLSYKALGGFFLNSFNRNRLTLFEFVGNANEI